jgi:protein O-GlcNAc transferase
MRHSSIEQIFASALQQHQLGRLAEAERGYREILQREPSHSDALHFLGVVAFQTGKLEPALELVQRSVALRPDWPVYQNNLGQVLERLGRSDEAARAYTSAIDLDPSYAEAFNNLGRILEKQDLPAQAEVHYRKAIRLDPAYAEPHTNLGNVLKDRGELDAAIASYRRAIELSPGHSALHSNLLLTLHYHPEYSPADLAREHREWARRHVAPLAAAWRTHANDATENRRLKIGYVSPDFREHAVARFIMPVLERHDRSQFETFAYADVARPDSVSDTIAALVDHWEITDALSDARLAERIRRDRIDILVDLAAHSGKNRLLAFARKPAPVQVTWLAYCSTTGVEAIDYRLTDRFLDPPDSDLACYTERSVYLPGSYWCYQAPAHELTNERRAPPPTFGCLNNFAKVTQPTLELWMRLLQQVPEAQLLLYAPPGGHRERISAAMQGAGLAPERLRFVSRQPFDDYLRTYRDIDVALDPFPWGGGTTTCDALWMGVPVVSLAGATAVSRSGSSLLSNVGLERLVAHSPEEYLVIAAATLRDTESLARMRRKLRSRIAASPIMAAAEFTRDLEAAYRSMWHTWCEDGSRSA